LFLPNVSALRIAVTAVHAYTNAVRFEIYTHGISAC